MRHLPAREFGNLSDNSSVEHPFRSSLRDIAENSSFSRQPGIGSPLDIPGNKLMKKYEDNFDKLISSCDEEQRDVMIILMEAYKDTNSELKLTRTHIKKFFLVSS